jgi:hypothetical protein
MKKRENREVLRKMVLSRMICVLYASCLIAIRLEDPIYIDNVARGDEQVQEIIKEVLQNIKK